jgi:hypothetical protein
MPASKLTILPASLLGTCLPVSVCMPASTPTCLFAKQPAIYKVCYAAHLSTSLIYTHSLLTVKSCYCASFSPSYLSLCSFLCLLACSLHVSVWQYVYLHIFLYLYVHGTYLKFCTYLLWAFPRPLAWNMWGMDFDSELLKCQAYHTWW